MIDEKFLNATKKLCSPTMGTENLAPYLYDLIRFIRPRKILELGGGYTSIFILKALSDNELFLKDNSSVDISLQNEQYLNQTFKPSKLHVIDNLIHEDSTANLIIDTSKKLKLDSFLEFHNTDYIGYAENIPKSELPLDLLWVDCGSLNTYHHVMTKYFPLVNKAGGIVLIHSLLTNLHGALFLKQLKLAQATNQFNDFELISLLEPHKTRQNSLTMLRFTTNELSTIYTTLP